MKKIIVLVLCCVILTGCATPSKVMQSWVGSHKSNLIASWGPPHNISSDGRDGEVFTYYYGRNLGQTPGQVRKDAWGNIQYTAPQQQGYTATRMFYVDSEGTIYNWRWQGY